MIKLISNIARENGYIYHQNKRLWYPAIKFARWQHPAMCCGRRLLHMAALLLCFV